MAHAEPAATAAHARDASAERVPTGGFNRLVLTARLIERGALRHTPAGLPVADLVFEHQSTVTEDGRPRQVSMQIKALVIGSLVQAVQALDLGAVVDAAGFLAQTRNGRGLLFHLTEFSEPSGPPAA